MTAVELKRPHEPEIYLPLTMFPSPLFCMNTLTTQPVCSRSAITRLWGNTPHVSIVLVFTGWCMTRGYRTAQKVKFCKALLRERNIPLTDTF